MPEPSVQKVKQALKQPRLLKQFLTGGQTPQKLQTDQKKEFLNQVLNSVLKQYNVLHFLRSNELNAAVVEHFNMTLRTKMCELF